MKPLIIPDSYNYIGVFLTFDCQYKCGYCINHHNADLKMRSCMNGDAWIKGLNRIQTRDDLPITFSGGEPTLHNRFSHIVNGIDKNINLDLLTNLDIDAGKFMKAIPASRFKREAPYASIRASYHPGQVGFWEFLEKVKRMKKAGYSIGVWEVLNHINYEGVKARQTAALNLGVDYRVKDFLGPWKGVNYGNMKYKDAVNSNWLRCCICKTSELLVGPSGYVYRCHSDLYADRHHLGHILDEDPSFLNRWIHCTDYGRCNACDIKIKTDRFQIYGHSSVEIKDIGEKYMKNNAVVHVRNTYGR